MNPTNSQLIKSPVNFFRIATNQKPFIYKPNKKKKKKTFKQNVFCPR